MLMRFRQARSPRRHRPQCEGLEARDLLSVLPASMASSSPRPAARATMTRSGASAGDQVFPNPAVIANSINLLYGPNSAAPMTPTPAEVKRQTFTAKFVGTYTIGPPRFNDRSLTIHAYSKDGGSNQFQMGKMQLVIFPPANPDAQPTPGDPYANQVTGIAALFTQNYLQTGGMAILDLNGLPTPVPGLSRCRRISTGLMTPFQAPGPTPVRRWISIKAQESWTSDTCPTVNPSQGRWDQAG